MKKIVAALLVVALSAVYAQAQQSQIVDGNVNLVGLGDAGLATAGVNIEAANGGLTGPAEAAPFQFFLANTETQVAFAALAPVTIGEGGTWNSGVGYSGAAGDLSVSYATAAGSVGAPLVPEPATGLLAVAGALGLLGFRRRR